MTSRITSHESRTEYQGASLSTDDAYSNPLTLDELRDFVVATGNWPGDTKLAVSGGASYRCPERATIAISSKKELP